MRRRVLAKLAEMNFDTLTGRVIALRSQIFTAIRTVIVNCTPK